MDLELLLDNKFANRKLMKHECWKLIKVERLVWILYKQLISIEQRQYKNTRGGFYTLPQRFLKLQAHVPEQKFRKVWGC